MVDIVNKICNQLVSYPYVIGIVINCGHFSKLSPEVTNANKHIDMCIISKEAINQNTLYTENDYFVNLRWYTQKTFADMINNQSKSIENKTILYDKIGFFKNIFNQIVK